MEKNTVTKIKKRKSFNAHCRMAFRGWIKCRSFFKKYKMFNDAGKDKCIVVLPYSDPEVAYFSLLYLDDVVRARGLATAVFITDSDAVIAAAKKMCVSISVFKKVSQKTIADIITFYSMTFYSDRLYIASLDEPFARHGKLLVGKHGITVEDIVVSGIYGIVNYLPKHRFDELNETDIEIRKIFDSGVNAKKPLAEKWLDKLGGDNVC